MGSSASAPPVGRGFQSSPDGPRHPLLEVVDNPINQFCDDFASYLVEEIPTSKQEQPKFPSNESEDIEGYKIIRRIGDGAEAAVFEVKKNGFKKKLALKRYKKVNNLKDGIPMEIEIAKLLKHPNCINIFESFRLASGEFIVSMPLAKLGSLHNTNQPEISPMEAVLLLDNIGKALQYMHSHGIIHRDIKPQNILVFNDHFTLCDYSVSAILKSEDELLSGYTGSPIFMAPEVSPIAYKPKPPDMWSLGVTVFSLLYGKYPYDLEKGLQQVEQNYVKNVARSIDLGELTFPDTPAVPNQLKIIIEGLLKKNPDERMTADQLMSSEWLQKVLSNWCDLNWEISDNTYPRIRT